MALTTNQLAYALRIVTDDDTAPDASTTAELTRLQGVASAYVGAFAAAAPESVKDEATILFIAYLYDGPAADSGGAALRYPTAWRNSGALGLLAPWRVQRAGLLGAATGAAAPGGGGGAGLDTAAVDARIRALVPGLIAAAGVGNGQQPGPGGLTQAQVDARVAALVADWAEQGNPAVIPAGKLTNAPTGGGGTVNVASDPSVVALREFAAALRFTGRFAGGSIGGTDRAGHGVDVAASTWVALAGFWPDTHTALDRDREFSVAVTYASATTTQRFDATALFNKVAGAAGGSTSSRNAIEFNLAAPNAGVTIYVGYVAADAEGRRGILVGIAPGLSGGAAAEFVINDSTIDLRPEARRSAPSDDDLEALAVKAIGGKLDAAQSGATDVRFIVEADGTIAGDLRDGTVDPAELRFAAGSIIEGRAVTIGAGASGFDSRSIAAQLHGVEEVHDGAITGLGITFNRSASARIELAGSASNRRQLASSEHGEFHVEVTVALTGTTAAKYGFADHDREVRATGLVFASTLRGTDTFVVGGSVEGVEVAEWDILDHTNPGSPTRVGYLSFYLAKDATNNVGWVLDYQTANPGGSDNGGVTARLALSYAPGDVPAAGGGGGGGGSTVTLVGTWGPLSAATTWALPTRVATPFTGSPPAGYTLLSQNSTIQFGSASHGRNLRHVLHVDVNDVDVAFYEIPVDEPLSTTFTASVAASIDVYRDIKTNTDNILRVLRLRHYIDATHNEITLFGTGKTIQAQTRMRFYRIELP